MTDAELAELVRAFADAWDRNDADDVYLWQSTWDAMDALRAAVGLGPAAGSVTVRRSVLGAAAESVDGKVVDDVEQRR